VCIKPGAGELCRGHGTELGLAARVALTHRSIGMLKFLGTTAGIIFLIGLLVVIGLLALIF
jgi:hypothetical protein